MFDAGEKPSEIDNQPSWTPEAIEQLIADQTRYYASGATRSEQSRRESLLKLRDAIRLFEPQLLQALSEDLRKSATEAYMTEIGVLLTEIREALKHLKAWMKPERCATPLALLPARSQLRHEPLGRCLIMSPWNYPVLLNLAPLVAALAAGNVAVIKPSEMAPATAAVIARLIAQTFPKGLVAVATGPVATSSLLLEQRWDLICFTGGTAVGRIVAQAAARHLTPCILELGGKSPCIVTDSANIEVAAKRIVWGKFMNAGQTCVAPDYVLASRAIYDQLLAAMGQELRRRFGPHPLQHPELPKIINSSRYQRLQFLLDPRKVAFGGNGDAARLLMEPTLLKGVERDDPIMQEEIFGPLLPVLPVRDLQHAEEIVRSYEKPLALYLFSEDKREHETVASQLSYGGGCINDVLVHTGNGALPFGGVGQSGMGSYHGIYGFKAFSHQKAIVFNTTRLDPPLRYGPWGRWHEKLFRWVLR